MKAFLDVDGVLANWCKGAHKLHDIPYSENSWPYARGVDGWDWYKEFGISTADLFKNMGYTFWRTLEWEPWGMDLFDFCERRFGDNLYLLTAPALTHGAVDGRLAWISEKMPKMRSRTLVATCKEACANKNAVLIDDSSPNVRKFMAHGGKSVLIPRAHNELEYMADGCDVVAWVRHNLDLMEAGVCQES